MQLTHCDVCREEIKPVNTAYKENYSAAGGLYVRVEIDKKYNDSDRSYVDWRKADVCKKCKRTIILRMLDANEEL